MKKFYIYFIFYEENVGVSDYKDQINYPDLPSWLPARRTTIVVKQICQYMLWRDGSDRLKWSTLYTCRDGRWCDGCRWGRGYGRDVRATIYITGARVRAAATCPRTYNHTKTTHVHVAFGGRDGLCLGAQLFRSESTKISLNWYSWSEVDVRMNSVMRTVGGTLVQLHVHIPRPPAPCDIAARRP